MVTGAAAMMFERFSALAYHAIICRALMAISHFADDDYAALRPSISGRGHLRRAPTRRA